MAEKQKPMGRCSLNFSSSDLSRLHATSGLHAYVPTPLEAIPPPGRLPTWLCSPQPPSPNATFSYLVTISVSPNFSSSANKPFQALLS